MASCFPKGQECIRDTMRNGFTAYRQWYSLVPPKHERSINVGDLGHFNREGEFIQLGKIFESSEKTFLKDGHTTEKWVGIPRSSPGVITSEEVVFDPFISRTTVWTHISSRRNTRVLL